jgi:hypothetical protein
MKRCTGCHKEKTISEYYTDYRNGKPRAKCKACLDKFSKISGEKWRGDNSAIAKKKRRDWYLANMDLEKKRADDWRKENPEKVKVIKKTSYKKLVRNPKGKLNMTMSGAINTSLRGNKAGRHWESLVGYTVDQLKSHLEKQFLPGMTWENHGKWHIDHRIPISAFNFEKPEDIDFKQCWALRNLRPLWAIDNLIKSNKLCRPFQPSLRLENVA